MRMIQELLEHARQDPNRDILYGDSGEGWTYRELCKRAYGLSTFLEKRGQGRTGLLMQKTRPFAASFFGALMAGRVPVPINYYLGSDALTYICNTSNLSTVITDGSLPEKEEAIPTDVRRYSEVREEFSGDPVGPSSFSVDEHVREVKDSFSILLFTSGTTSNPKGVMLTEENIISNLTGSRSAMDLRTEDHFLSSLPLFHSFGLTCGLLLPLLSGIPTTVESTFSPGRVLDTIPERNVTIYLAVPSQYRALAKRGKQYSDLTPFHERHDSIRFISGGEPFPEPARNKVKHLFEQPILEGYGLTETSPVVSVNQLHDFKEGTTGRPLDNLQVRITSTEDPESPAQDGERGEIQVKGPSVMNGYLHAERESFTSDGWFRTGDVGILDEDGYLKVTGRIKDLIISSGENVSPLHIQEFLLKQPDIEQAAVVGIPDRTRGEVPAAFVTVKDNQDLDVERLRHSIREHLGKLHVPADVHVMDELPMGPTGKVLKRKLTDMISQDHS